MQIVLVRVAVRLHVYGSLSHNNSSTICSSQGFYRKAGNALLPPTGGELLWKIVSRNSSCTGMMTGFPITCINKSSWAKVAPETSFIRVLRREPSPSLAPTLVAPCFCARDREEIAKSVVGQRRGWVSVDQRCDSRIGRRGNGVSEGLAPSPCSRYCFTLSSSSWFLL